MEVSQLDSHHKEVALAVWGRPGASRLRPWLGALGYFAAQALISLLGISWGPLGWGLAGQGLLLVSCMVGLVAAGYLSRYFEHHALQYLLLSIGWPIALGAVAVAWHEPYAFVRELAWLEPASSRAVLHPFFTVGVSVLLFLVALGHTVAFGPHRRRWICMDAPLLAVLALCLVLHLRGYPSFEG